MAATAQAQTTPTAADPVERWLDCPANGSLKGPCPGYFVEFGKPPQNMRWRKLKPAKEHPK